MAGSVAGKMTSNKQREIQSAVQGKLGNKLGNRSASRGNGIASRSTKINFHQPGSFSNLSNSNSGFITANMNKSSNNWINMKESRANTTAYSYNEFNAEDVINASRKSVP